MPRAPPIRQPHEAERGLVEGLADRCERDEVASDDAGVNARPVKRALQDVAEHDSKGDLQGEAGVVRVGEGVGTKGP